MEKWIEVPVETLNAGDTVILNDGEESVMSTRHIIDDSGKCHQAIIYVCEITHAVKLPPGAIVKRRRTVLDITPEELAKAHLITHYPQTAIHYPDARRWTEEAEEYLETLRKLAAELEKEGE